MGTIAERRGWSVFGGWVGVGCVCVLQKEGGFIVS